MPLVHRVLTALADKGLLLQQDKTVASAVGIVTARSMPVRDRSQNIIPLFEAVHAEPRQSCLCPGDVRDAPSKPS